MIIYGKQLILHLLEFYPERIETIFLAKEDVELARKGVVYLDGKKSDAKVDKIWQVADTQNISAYRCEILLSAPESFSILKKIEFKEK